MASKQEESHEVCKEVTADTYKGPTNDFKAELSRLKKEYGNKFKPLYERKWIKIDNKKVDDQKENDSKSAQLSLLQFNILADGLSGAFNTGKKQFDKSPKESLLFKYRGFRILEAIISANADIVTLEEVDTFGFLSYYLEPMGYCGCHQPKPKSPCVQVGISNNISLPPDGVAIFYKKDKFAVNVYKYTRPVVAILIAFRFLEFDKEFLCGVTHLKAVKTKKGEEKRLEQLNGLFAEWLKVKKALNGIDLFIGCDFNSPPKDTSGFPPMAYLSVVDGTGFMEKYVEKKGDDEIKVPKDYVCGYGLDLSSAYANGFGQEPPFTTYKSRGDHIACHTIDYIFYEEGNWNVKELLSVPDDDEIDKNEYLPGWKYPSDHFSIGAVFQCPKVEKSKNENSAPIITRFEWGVIGISHNGKNMVFKDAILTPNGAKSWNWKLDGTRHKPGVTKEALMSNKLCEDADVVIVTRGVNLVLQTKDETKKYLESAKENGLIKDYMILQSNEAVAEYGRLIEKGQKVAGLFHSTC